LLLAIFRLLVLRINTFQVRARSTRFHGNDALKNHASIKLRAPASAMTASIARRHLFSSVARNRLTLIYAPKIRDRGQDMNLGLHCDDLMRRTGGFD
jgi:hypothetical protein